MATIEQALEQVSVLLDQRVEKCVSAYEVILRDFGASDAELVAELARMRADCVEKRTRALSQVKAWLETCRLERDERAAISDDRADSERLPERARLLLVTRHPFRQRP